VILVGDRIRRFSLPESAQIQQLLTKKSSSGSVIVHELAHQWFGNLVTMEFWDGLWLNESFADWAELYAWETLDPSWQMWQAYDSRAYQSALTLDANRASHPIEVPVHKATELVRFSDLCWAAFRKYQFEAVSKRSPFT
jgi:aminopeptidase N